jgi:glutaredoxin
MKKQILLLFVLILSITLINADNIISSPDNKSTCIYVFYLEGCPHCENLDNYIQTIENNYNLDIKHLSARTNSELMKNLSEYYNVPKNNWGSVPLLFIGDSYCLGDIPCINLLNEKLEQYKETGVSCVIPNLESKEISIKELTLLGLVDAVNPCEMAVLLLVLTTILLRYPDRKKKVLISGLVFSLALFLGYFLIGLFIIFGFKSVLGITSISSLLIRRFLGGIAILLGLFNLKDYLFYKPGGFATEMPLSWRPRMKKLIEGVSSVKSVFIIGILITIFLVPCTSGPYFIAGGILANLSVINALPWLIYYNLLFISPMLVITLIVYSGLVKVEHVSRWKEKNIRKLHLIAGIIMILLGLQIIFGVL